MIELRWLDRECDRHDPFDGWFKTRQRVLQYRNYHGRTDYWEPWQDIPFVIETGTAVSYEQGRIKQEGLNAVGNDYDNVEAGDMKERG